MIRYRRFQVWIGVFLFGSLSAFAEKTIPIDHEIRSALEKAGIAAGDQIDCEHAHEGFPKEKKSLADYVKILQVIHKKCQEQRGESAPATPGVVKSAFKKRILAALEHINQDNPYDLSANAVYELVDFVESNKKHDEDNAYYRAKKRVEELKGFYGNLISYCCVVPVLVFVNLKYSPEFQWFWFSAAGSGPNVFFIRNYDLRH